MGVLPAVYNEGEPAVLQPFDMFGVTDGTEGAITMSASPDTEPADPDFKDLEDDETTSELGENLLAGPELVGHCHSQEATLSQIDTRPEGHQLLTMPRQ